MNSHQEQTSFETKPSSWPNGKQWRQFFNVVSKREKYVLLFLCLMILVGGGILGTKLYVNQTKIIPAGGGSLNIAMIGYPRFLNPVLNQLNNLDRDLTPIFFSSLMKYDNSGKLIGDLTDSYNVSDDGKTYTIVLKKNIKWHDGKTLTADDVIFTLDTIVNQEYKSPLRTLWQGVEYSKIDDQTIRFVLKNPYAPFLHTLTFGILPKHLWEDVTPAQFPLKDLNLKPIGSGPYQFSRFLKDSDGKIVRIETKSFSHYFEGKAYVSSINFQFYDSEEKAIAAYKKGEVNAINFISASNRADIQKENPNLIIYSITLPRYFAIFFNQSQNPILSDKNVRQALAFAIDKKTLIEQVLNGQGKVVESPILEGMTGYSDQVKKYNLDIEKAKSLLNTAGWKKITVASTTASTTATTTLSENIDADILQKDGKKLEITLTTNDWPELTQTAELIKQQWTQLGVKVNVDIKETAKIQNETIRPRQYQALLFGEVLGVEPDPFSFWHSSQAKDPGLNLSEYSNPDVDKILLDAHQDLDQDSRAQKYKKLSELVTEDLPAIFLFNPNYLFAADKNIKGIEFSNLNNISSYLNRANMWFIKTTRAWK